jgi:hypothetical protein
MLGLPKNASGSVRKSSCETALSLADRPGRDVSQKEEFGAPEEKGIGATLEENGGDDETRTRDLCRDRTAGLGITTT